MPNTPVRAAADGLPTITRRSFLRTTAAAGAVAATATVPAAETAAELQANPELLSLFRALDEAVAEKAAAKAAKEWLVDEWQHRWPLAPDEIALPGIKSHSGEVDMAGRPLIRPGEACARRVPSRITLKDWVDCMAHSVEKSRTEKARARRLAALATAKRELELGEEYYSEIERVKEASGIRSADTRIAAADREISRLSNEIMALPASSLACLAVKAEAAEIWGKNAGLNVRADLGPFGWAWRFSNDILNVTKGASV